MRGLQHQARQHGDALAGCHERLRHLAVVDAIGDVRLEPGLAAAPVDHPEARAVGAEVGQQPVLRAQVAEAESCFSRSSRCPRGRTTSHGSSSRGHEIEALLRHRGRLGIVERDAEVELAGAERAYDRRRHADLRDRDVDLGVARAERAQRVDDHRRAGARERPDPEAAGREIGDRVELELGDGELLEDGCRHVVPARCRPRSAAAAAVPRSTSVVPTCCSSAGDDLRDGRLRVVEQVGGGRERSRLAHRLEDAKLPEFHSCTE